MGDYPTWMYGPIRNYNVSQVTNMHKLFSDAEYFNQDLSNWNVGKVTDMGWMFSQASAFNQDLSK